MADQGDRLTERDPQIDPFEDRLVGPVAEGDAFEDEFSLMTSQRDGVLGVANSGLPIELFVDTVGGGHRL